MEKTQKRSTKKTVISLVLLSAVVISFAVVYYLLSPRGEEGLKTITIEIVFDGDTFTREITTDAAYLRQALDEAMLIGGEDSGFGFWVTTVYGRVANEENQEWWALYVNEEFAMRGVDELPIEDGDVFLYRLVVGFDDSIWED